LLELSSRCAAAISSLGGSVQSDLQTLAEAARGSRAAYLAAVITM
jgi:hypothetical protein